MCPPHMKMAPAPLREAIRANYPAGQEHGEMPSPEYLAIARAAVDAAAHKEARAAPRTPSPRRGKPVQLALFDLAEPIPGRERGELLTVDLHLSKGNELRKSSTVLDQTGNTTSAPANT
ncbi:hypothetical protein BH09ACT8_BH09ACT8_08580 [soil metagenome]